MSMKNKNVALVTFAVPSEAFEAFAELKDNASTDTYTVEQAGVLRNNGGGDVIVDSFGDDSVGDDVAFGGLIGALVGLLGGPFGVLVGGSVGLFAGGIKGESDDDRNSSLISLVAGKLGEGQAGIVALLSEDVPDDFDANFEAYDVNIYRWPAEEVEEAVRVERERRAEDAKAEREEAREARKEDREVARANRAAEREEEHDERHAEREEERAEKHDA